MAFCSNCGAQIDDTVKFCTNCGAPIAGPNAAPASNQAPQAAPAYGQAPQAAPVYSQAPAKQLRTNRSFIKTFLLSMITFGIYGLCVYSHVGEELNMVATPHDGKHTTHFCLVFFILSWLTAGIYPLVWNHKICNRMAGELNRRSINYSFSASTFWLWGILGSLIVVGPIVYTHKLLKAMNLINASYNAGFDNIVQY